MERDNLVFITPEFIFLEYSVYMGLHPVLPGSCGEVVILLMPASYVSFQFSLFNPAEHARSKCKMKPDKMPKQDD